MNRKRIDILNVLSLRGPSMWTYPPVLEAWVDIGELEDFPSNLIPGFYERLSSWLPTLIEHRCSYDERGGFLRRVQEGTWPGHILEHVTLELQNLAGLPGGFGKARETSTRGVYRVVVSAYQEEVTRAALATARDLVMAAIEDRPFDVPGALDALRDLVNEYWLGPSTASIVQAAEDRRIPYIRLNQGNLVQFGYGAAQHRIWTAETDRTSAVAEGIACDKDLTKSLLQACGVPVPEGRMVQNKNDAWEAAQDIGLPVVIKPCDGNHGRGVFLDLNTREAIETAFGVASGEGSGVIVERYVPGNEHRLLVVGDRLVAAARGKTASVTGDGKSTILELIAAQLNSDPRRGNTEEHPLNLVALDSAARIELERQGCHGDAVPPEGEEVLIQRNGNVAFDCTDEVHPSIAAHVRLAARIVGLDIAGIDLVAEDISRPLEEQGGAIVEVNAGPGLLMHLKPADGQPRPVGRAIVDHLFPNGGEGRIPLVGVSGSHGTTLVTQLVGQFLRLSGLRMAAASSEGLFFDRRRVQADGASWEAARRALRNPMIEAAVIENGARAILTEGLAYDRCQVGVITSLDPAQTHPDLSILEPQQIYNVLRTQVDVVLPTGYAVLNGDDGQVADMARLCDGEAIFYALDRGNARVAEHLAQGRRAVYAAGGAIVLAQGEAVTELTPLSAIPCLAGHGDLGLVLAGVAAGWALDLPLDCLRAGVESYSPPLRAYARPPGGGTGGLAEPDPLCPGSGGGLAYAPGSAQHHE
ncbi:Cyanophycin synthetase [Pigmentiphaga humi]|uniref:Cyanophycin synthetase n=1 Tax=Pigmentiphaga humi TaxID=2478468 RepID=A0A3P4AZ49_9BURK|nr:cyanophycin synthetase [Pigmentiphaga humi]VCU69313.1 Cyanophycin synthetase [Pigmentiphaga humi]